MRRPSFLKTLASWTGRSRGLSAGEKPWLRVSIRPTMASFREVPVSFSPEQLDQLGEMLAPGCDVAASHRPSLWHDAEANSVSGQARVLHAVDRAIADLASPRGRRKRARW
jgi:hypothetical protein